MVRSIRIVALAGLLAVVPCGAAQAAPRNTSDLRVTHGTSTNWSGYSVSGHGPYGTVSASWVQPAVDCTQTPTGYSSFWVGLDGNTTGTVEQTGTEADCSSGHPRYLGWYEMFPKFPVNYSNPVAPGDVMHASVTYTGHGKFELTLSNRTQGWTRTVTPRSKRAGLGSAEVIAEAPSSSGGVLPLADYGTVGFSGASVDGVALSSSTPGIEPITMVTGGTVRARPGPVSGGSFSDVWQHQ